MNRCISVLHAYSRCVAMGWIYRCERMLAQMCIGYGCTIIGLC